MNYNGHALSPPTPPQDAVLQALQAHPGAQSDDVCFALQNRLFRAAEALVYAVCLPRGRSITGRQQQ